MSSDEHQPLPLDHDWFPAPVPENVAFGSKCWLYSACAFLHYRSRKPVGLRIGQGTGIYVHSFFNLGPEAEVQIGSYCTLNGAIISTNGRVSIGDYVFLSLGVVIADRPTAIPFTASEPCSCSAIIIGKTSWIGARAIILPGAHLGEGAVIGAGAVVDFDVPPFAVVAGNPAKVVGSTNAVNSAGLPLTSGTSR